MAIALADNSDPSQATFLDWRERHDSPVWAVTLWPNRSLSPEGKRTVLRIAALGFAMPLIPSFGTPVFWGLLPFCLGTLAFLAWGFRRCDRDGRLTEDMTVWRDEVRVERREPSGRILRWSAHPHFLRTHLHDGAKVESYLTLGGGNREIEFGAFLSPEERVALKDEIDHAISRALTGRAAPGH